MKQRPILFSTPMVRALLAGSKTQTRRALKVLPPPGTFQVSTYNHPDPRPHFFAWQELPHEAAMIADDWAFPCPYGQPGDQLWVREAWSHDAESLEHCRASYEDAMGPGSYGPYYRATESAPDTLRWKPSIHMPRWASRITLEITAVRVERLQDIGEADAKAEGMMCSAHPLRDCRMEYADLWEQLNGSGAWRANPWVWVVEFKRVKQLAGVRV